MGRQSDLNVLAVLRPVKRVIPSEDRNRRASLGSEILNGYTSRLGFAQQSHVEKRIRLRESNRNIVSSLALGPDPRTCGVNRFTVLFEPCTQRLQPTHLDSRNCSVGLGPNIEQEISILADNIDQQINQLVRRDCFGFTLGAVIS